MTALNRKLDTVTVSMNYVELNNFVIKMKMPIQKAKHFIIKKLSVKIEILNKKKKGLEVSLKNENVINRITDEIQELKKLKKEYYVTVAKQALYCDTAFDKIAAKENAKQRSYARIGYHPEVQKYVLQFRKDHKDWKSLAAYLLSKNTGRRYKNKKVDSDFIQDSISNTRDVFKSSRIQDSEFLIKDEIQLNKQAISMDYTSETDIEKVHTENEQGTTEQGTTEQGTTEQGTIEQSTTEQGTTVQGTAEQGTTEQGTTEQSTTEQGTIEQGTTEQGTTEQDTTEQSTTEQGTTVQDTTEQGTAEQDSDNLSDIALADDNESEISETVCSESDFDDQIPSDSDEMDTSDVNLSNSEMVIEKFDMELLQSSNVPEISKESTNRRSNISVAKKSKFKLQEDDFFMAGSSDDQSDDDEEIEETKIVHKKKEVSCKEARKNICCSSFVGSLASNNSSLSKNVKHQNKEKSETKNKKDTNQYQKNLTKEITANESKCSREVKQKNIFITNKKIQMKNKTKDDETEVLHPSWEASRKKKMESKNIKFSGTKISFDD